VGDETARSATVGNCNESGIWVKWFEGFHDRAMGAYRNIATTLSSGARDDILAIKPSGKNGTIVNSDISANSTFPPAAVGLT